MNWKIKGKIKNKVYNYFFKYKKLKSIVWYIIGKKKKRYFFS